MGKTIGNECGALPRDWGGGRGCEGKWKRSTAYKYMIIAPGFEIKFTLVIACNKNVVSVIYPPSECGARETNRQTDVTNLYSCKSDSYVIRGSYVIAAEVKVPLLNGATVERVKILAVRLHLQLNVISLVDNGKRTLIGRVC